MAAIGDKVVDAARQTALEQASALKQESLDLKAQNLTLGDTPIPGEPIQDKLDRARQLGISEEEILQATRGKYGNSEGIVPQFPSRTESAPETPPLPASSLPSVDTAAIPPAFDRESALAALRGTQQAEVATPDPVDRILQQYAPKPAEAPITTSPDISRLDAEREANLAQLPEGVNPNTDIADIRTLADVPSALYSGTIGVGNTIIDSFVGAPAEFIATLGSDKTNRILTKERNGVALTEEEMAYKQTFDFLTQERTIDTVQGGREASENAFKRAREFVETDRVKFAKEEVQQALSESFDNDVFLESFISDLADNPLGTLAYVTESIPFMFAAASKATRLPFSVAFTGENYKTGLQIYEKEFGDVPDESEKALILLGSAFIAALNSSAARIVTGEALVKNMSSRMMKTSVGEYLTTAATKLGTKLTPAESNEIATMLLKAGRLTAVPAAKLAGKAGVEFVQEASEPLISSATAKQSLDFDRETVKEAAIGGAIGFAAGGGIGGSVDLIQATGEKLVERQKRVLRERAARENGVNQTAIVKDASSVSINPEFRTDWEGVDLGVDENYDPLTAAQRGPADENSASDIRKTIGHIKNSIRVAIAFDPTEIETNQAIGDYMRAVQEQASLLTNYEEQIQQLAQREIQTIEQSAASKPEVAAQVSDKLKDVYFGSDSVPIDSSLIEDLKRQFETYKDQFSSEDIADIQAKLTRADAVKTSEEAIRQTPQAARRDGKSAAEVHDEVINGSKNPDGSRRHKGGATYRQRLNGFIVGEDRASFDKEMDQLRNFIRTQRSKLPDDAPERQGETAVYKNREGKDGRPGLRNSQPIIAKEVDYLVAIEQEALANSQARPAPQPKASRAAVPPGPDQASRSASPTGEGANVAPEEPQATATFVSQETPVETGAEAVPRITEVSAETEVSAVKESAPVESDKAIPAPETNPNLESTIPIRSAKTDLGVDIRPISQTFKSVKDITNKIFLRNGAFSSFETLLATAQDIAPDMNLTFNSKGYKALRQVFKRYKNFDKVQKANNLKQLGTPLVRGSESQVFGATYANNLALGLTVETEPNVYQFRPEVVAAMSVATALWIKEEAYRTLNVDAFTLGRWFGVDERDVPVDALNKFRDRGVPRLLVAQSIGDRIYQTLGIQPSPDAPVEAKSKMAQSLGLIALEAMAARNEIVVEAYDKSEIDADFWGEDSTQAREAAQTRKQTGEEPKVNLIKVAYSTDTTTNLKQVHPSFSNPAQNAATVPYTDIPNLGNTLFGIQADERAPLEEPKESLNLSIRGGNTEVTSEQQRAMKASQQIQHQTNMNTAGLLVELGRDFMRNLLGYTENPEQTAHVDSMDSIEGQNNGIDEQITNLIDHVEKFDSDDKPFHFGIFLSSSRRSFYDSNRFNPQDKSLHRFNVKLNNPPAVIPTDVDAPGFENFLVAITTGLGLKDEKATLEQHTAAFKEFATDAKLTQIRKAIASKNGKAILSLLPEPGAHGFQALIELDQWAQARGSDTFVTSMTMETDGVTNGAAIGFMQLAHTFSTDAMWKWLERIGVYQGTSDVKGFQDWKSRGNNDSYQHMASKVTSYLLKQQVPGQTAVQAILGPLSDENGVTKSARNLMKYPFMIHNYGASTPKILEAISSEVIDKWIAQVEEAVANKDINALNTLSKHINDIYGKPIVTLTLENALDTSLRPWRRRLEQRVFEVVKEPVTLALNDELGDFVEVRKQLNEAFQTQFFAFDIAYTAKLDALMAANKAQGRNFITEQQATEAMAEVQHLLPGFQGAMTNTKPQNRIPVIKSKTDMAHQDKNRVVQIYLTHANGLGNKSAKDKAAKKVFVDGGVSGVILAIHSLDATVQQRAQEILRKQPGGPEIISIFDAGITDPMSSPVYAKIYNQVFIETMRDYSLLKDVRAMMTAIESSPELDKRVQEAFVVKGRDGNAPKYRTVNELLRSLDYQIELNEERKAEVFGQNLTVEQMVHPAQKSMYEYTPTAAKPVVFANRAEEIPDAVRTKSDSTGTSTQKDANQTEQAATVQPAEKPVRQPDVVVDPNAPVESLQKFVEDKLKRFPKVVQDMVDVLRVVPHDDPSLNGGVGRAFIDEKGNWTIVISDRLNAPAENLNVENKPWWRGLNRQQMISKVFHHELGHVIDYALKVKHGERPSGPWKQIAVRFDSRNRYKNAGVLSRTKTFMSYAYENVPDTSPDSQAHEVFAELFAWYIVDRKSMINEQPDLADYIGETYGAIFKEAQPQSTPTDEEGDPIRKSVSPEVQNTPEGQKQAAAKAEADEAVSDVPGPGTLKKGSEILISSQTEKVPAEVRDSFTLYGYEFAIHRTRPDSKEWTVTEVSTGLRAGIHAHKTQKAAKEDAVRRLTGLGKTKLDEVMARSGTQTSSEEQVSQGAKFTSSDRQVDINKFKADSVTTVTSDNVRTVFDSLAGLTAPSNLSPEYRTYLRDLVDGIITRGIEPLDQLILKMKSDQEGAFGAIVGNEIYMNNNSTRETYAEQSAEEVFVHELLHAISAEFINNNPAGRNKLRRLYEIARKNVTWKDFLKYDAQGNVIVETDMQTEVAQAKATYDYVFNQRNSTNRRGTVTNNALHEFFTYALSNEQMITKLRTIPTRESKFTKDGNLLESFISYLEDIFNYIAETFNDTSAPNIQQEVFNLANNIIAVEQSSIFKTLNAIEHGFAKGRLPIDRSVSFLVTQTANMIRAVVPRAKRESLLSAIPNTLRTVANTVLYHQNMQGVPEDNPVSAAVKDATGALLSGMTAEDGVLRKTMNSVINRSAEFKDWHKMLRNSKHLIDQLRSTVSSTIAINVRDRFSQPLTKAENKAVTRAFLQTDVDSLVSYSLDQIERLMSDEKYLTDEIAAKRKALFKSYNPAQRKYLAAQSIGLAKLMTHGYTNTYNQNLNVHQILNELATLEDVTALDEYISLLALKELPRNGREAAAAVIRREQLASRGDNGITYLRAQHRAFKQESQKRLFSDNPMLMQKGYMAEVYDQSVSVQIADLSDKEWMRSEGYVLVGEVNDDSTVLSPKKKGLYVASNNPNVQRLKSIVSVADKAVKGTTLASSARAAGQGYSRVLDSLQISRTRAQYSQAARTKRTADGHRLIPVKNENGDIVNYRYQMVEEMREKYLKKDYDIGTVMGAMHASIESKANSEAINAEAVRAAHADWVENGEEQAEKFIPISNDPDSKYFETYKLMPDAMRREVDRVFGKNQPMMVRGELVDLIFGFRKATLANLPGIKDQPWEHVVRVIENGWQEIIAQEKVNIVIKTVDVMLNNIISNTILLKVLGIPMSDILKDTKEAIDGMNRYQQDFEELLALQKELAGDPRKAKSDKFVSRVEFLRNELKANPVGELVDEGIFQSITEDIDADQYGDKTKLLNWLQDTVGKHTPSFVKTGIEYAYISEHTQAFKFLMKVTQYSDFTARYVMWKHEMAKEGAQKDLVLNDIIRTFINYDDPSNKYAQWGNDMGIVMFTKFAIGIQNVIVRIAGKKTANLVTSLLAQEWLGDQSDITDSFLLSGGITHMFHLDPVEHVKNAFAPFGIVTAQDYLF